MTRRQRLVLDILPLLYHCNHPALPGYVNTTVPAGIPSYRPSAQTRQAARQVAAGFRQPPYREQPVNLQSIFIMGSSGSIAQNRASDVDLWVFFPFGRNIVCVTLNDGALATTSHASETDLRAELGIGGRITYDRSSVRLAFLC